MRSHLIPDRKLLASGSSSGIKLWNLDLDYLIECSCDRVLSPKLHLIFVV
ncbi:MAG: hypothetical protein F6K14_01440 [Symploca sp. SIO2C1]|nr:hypothetical protein [Symploca sp. SIO2C1]